MTGTRLFDRRVVLACLLVSLLLHAGVASLVDEGGHRRVERLRVMKQPLELERQHGVQPALAAREDLPRLPMEAYVAPAVDGEVSVDVVPLPAVAPVLPDGYLQQRFEKQLERAREQGVAWAEGVLRALVAAAAQDSAAAGEMLDLLRLSDLADADKERATIIHDPRFPKQITGYINFTFLRIYGAGSYSSFNGGQNRLDAVSGAAVPSNASAAALPDLARYMRDYTGILARVRSHEAHEFFLSRELLKDPIHFLFEGGGVPAYSSERVVRFFPEERQLLGEYLRGGGFLFIEGSNRFLREFVDELEGILAADGRLVELDRDHPIYSAYYTYGDGFPGEYKRRLLDVRGPAWYYPSRFPVVNYPEGLWGVEVGGRLVAVLSDLQILGSWQMDAQDAEGSPVVVKGPRLSAATNIVVFALTQEGGLTARRERPLWAAATGVTRRVY